MKKPKARVCAQGTNTLSIASAHRFLTQHADSSLHCCRENSMNCVLKCVGLVSVSVVFVRFYLHESHYIRHVLKLFHKSHIYWVTFFLTSSLWVLFRFCFALLSRVYVYERLCSCSYVCACFYTCGGQKLTSDVSLDLCPFYRPR